jgi:hypothetical protein
MLENLKNLTRDKLDKEYFTESFIYEDLEDKEGFDEKLFQEYSNLHLVPVVNKKQRYFIQIIVRGSERNINHIHFYRNKNEIKTNTGGCLMLSENRYYNHGKHQATLKEYEFNAIVKWFKEISKSKLIKELILTNW